MKAAEADLLILPDRGDAGPDHWQSRWQAKLSTARRVVQDNWQTPNRDQWVGRIIEATTQTSRPIVFLAHGLGVTALVHTAPKLPRASVAAAFLVAPVDAEEGDLESDIYDGFTPIPRDPLPFPSMLVASRSDPACRYDRADDLGHAWGSFVIDGGAIGGINIDSGHGPWPEGSLTFARFLSSIKHA